MLATAASTESLLDLRHDTALGIRVSMPPSHLIFLGQRGVDLELQFPFVETDNLASAVHHQEHGRIIKQPFRCFVPCLCGHRFTGSIASARISASHA